MRAPRPDTAAAHLITDVPVAAPDQTAGSVREQIAGQSFAATDAVFVLDAGRHLLGVVPMRELLAAPADREVRALRTQATAAVPPGSDQEHVAWLALARDLVTVPVVAADGTFAGTVPGPALLAILHREHVEDLHRLAGISREEHQAKSALEDPPVRRAHHRLPWLLVGLAGSLLSAGLMAEFDELLRRRVQIAFFLPAIVYLADAIGTQTEAIAVRGLSLARLPWLRLLGGEVRTGIWLGGVLGLLALPAVFLGTGDWSLAAAVALAILTAGVFAATVGLLLPSVLARLDRDPAFGSGPLATIVQDLVSIAIYLALASWLVG